MDRYGSPLTPSSSYMDHLAVRGRAILADERLFQRRSKPTCVRSYPRQQDLLSARVPPAGHSAFSGASVGTPFPARASPSIRRTVASPTRSRGAAARMHRAPASKTNRTAGHARRTSGRSARGRPKCRPCRRARSIPALTRSRSTLRELGVGDGDVVDGLTERRRGVEPRFLVGAEPDASGPESLQGLGRVQDRPDGPVQPPDQDAIRLAFRGIVQ